MKCTTCGKKMELKREDESANFNVTPEKKYSRKVYVCPDCDVWITTETPSSIAS